MNRQEASLFFRLRVVSCSPVPPNNALKLSRPTNRVAARALPHARPVFIFGLAAYRRCWTDVDPMASRSSDWAPQ